MSLQPTISPENVSSDQLSPSDSSSSSILLATAQSIELGTLTKRFEMTLDDDVSPVSPVLDIEDDDDDEEVVGDEDDDDEEEELNPGTLQLLESMTADPELVKQMLTNIQARFKNFEDILADVRLQLVEVHERDEDIVKRMATLNEEIAELNLLESYDTASARSAAVAGDSFADTYSDYGVDAATLPVTTKSSQASYPM